MKVVHLITSLGIGGAERQLVALVNGHSPDIHHVVISLQDEGVMGKHFHTTPIYSLNLHQSPLKGLWKLYRILRSERPDILQTWLYHADLLGLIFGKFARIPHIVWNVRCSNMDMSHYSKRTALIVKLLAWLSPYPQAVITNSQAGQAFHTHIGYTPRQWVPIPNGINTDLFQPNPKAGQTLRQVLKIPEDAIVIGMLGRVDPMKDYPTFLTAMKTLQEENENLYGLIAGKDTKNIERSMLSSRLISLDAYEKVPDFLNALDIFVLSSAFGEGFPNVVAEAMACGIPTIVTDVGDAAMIVQTPDQIVPPQNTGQLTLAIRKLLALSYEERNRIGQKSRERILTTYGLPTMREKYATFYKTLINRKSKEC